MSQRQRATRLSKKPVREYFAGGLAYRDGQQRIWLSGRGALVVIAGTIPVLFLFDHLGRYDLALPAIISVIVLSAPLMLKWQLRRYVWFWMTLIFLAGLHVALILLVPWPHKWVPAQAIIPIAYLDLYAILRILALVERQREGRKSLQS